jgi:Tfp pilus assembly protein PilX
LSCTQVDELAAARDDLERSLAELQEQLRHAEAALKAKEEEIEELQVITCVSMCLHVCACTCVSICGGCAYTETQLVLRLAAPMDIKIL